MAGQGVTNTPPPGVIHVLASLLLTRQRYRHLPAMQVGPTITSSFLWLVAHWPAMYPFLDAHMCTHVTTRQSSLATWFRGSGGSLAKIVE